MHLPECLTLINHRVGCKPLVEVGNQRFLEGPVTFEDWAKFLDNHPGFVPVRIVNGRSVPMHKVINAFWSIGPSQVWYSNSSLLRCQICFKAFGCRHAVRADLPMQLDSRQVLMAQVLGPSCTYAAGNELH